MKNKIIDKLRHLLMTERQAKLYYALITQSNSTATELHRLTNIPLNKTYETLKELNSKGFCVKKTIGKKIIYSATSPAIAFANVINDKLQEIDDIKDLKKDIQTLFDSVPTTSNTNDFLEIVNGSLNVHKKYLDLYNQSSKIVLGIGASPYTRISKKRRLENQEAYDNFIARGGSDKTITELNENTPPFVFSFIKSMIDNDVLENNRVMEKCPLKLAIFDNEVLITVDKANKIAEEDICASIIKQPITVKTYVEMFNYMFEKAITIDSWIDNNKELYNSKLKEFNSK